jgi:HSP20 family protein
MVSMLRHADQPTLSLREAMDRLFEQSFTPFARGWNGEGGYQQGFQQVPSNLWEDGHNYYLHLLVPGVDPASVEITTMAGSLSITGELTTPAPEGGKAIWQEWGSVKFRRQFQLPAGFDAERCQATYADGVLTVTVPKPEQIKPKSIKIQTGNGTEALPAKASKS